MPGDAVGKGENCQNGIEAAVGDVQGGVGDVEVVVAVDAAPLIGDGGLRVLAHAAGSGLVLAAAEAQAGGFATNIARPGGTEPVFGAGAEEVIGSQGFRVGRAG